MVDYSAHSCFSSEIRVELFHLYMKSLIHYEADAVIEFHEASLTIYRVGLVYGNHIYYNSTHSEEHAIVLS